jgi:hypothetical protein
MKDWFADAKTTSEIFETQINIPVEIPEEMPKYVVDRLQFFNKEPDSLQDFEDYFSFDSSHSTKEHRLKDAYQSAGMYGFVSWRWVRPFVEWIGQRKVLEVMAGRGWLTYALRQKGVDVVAIDDFSWFTSYDPITDVIEMDAVTAVDVYKDVDIVIMSWPFMDNTAYQVLKKMHESNPSALLVYIGEYGGCTADELFFDHLVEVEDESFKEVARNFQSWHGFHDHLMLGRYEE